MSAVPKMAAVSKPQGGSDAGSSLQSKFDARESKELVIAFAGPIGCDISSLVEAMSGRLIERGYTDVVHIKLSNFLNQAIDTRLVQEWAPLAGNSERLVRYRRLQEAGKDLRSRTGNPAILAEYAAREIAIDRVKRQGVKQALAGEAIVPGRVAYLVDQVKRPEEVALLRAVYRNLFYLAGITRIYDGRVAVLTRERVRSEEVHGLMEIDRLEDGKDGQQLDKTLHLADYFFRNDTATVDEQRQKLNRFLDLVHGDKSVTPTDAEQGMYAAYCASLRSACLSRQVGAAIATSTGEVIATGCNDVPQAGGGLYTAKSKEEDKRCVRLQGQQCFNDHHKKQMQTEIGEIIDSVFQDPANSSEPLAESVRSKLLEAIYKKTRLKDLIEFSRSVHAEMDAIVSLARIGGTGLHGATLYTTTFPCHNCARHIVASGIVKVFYVEPYEKSLAKDLHSDAIAFEIEENKSSNRVEFLHFEGVSPRQFHSMFRAVTRKNAEGKFVPIKIQEADKVVPEYLDSYRDFETKAVEHLESEIGKLSKSG